MENRRRSNRIAKLLEGVEEKVKVVEKKSEAVVKAPKRTRGKKVEEIPEKKSRTQEIEDDPAVEVELSVQKEEKDDKEDAVFVRPASRPRRSTTNRRVSYTPEPMDVEDSMINMSSSSSEAESSSDENEFSFSVKEENQKAASKNAAQGGTRGRKKPVKAVLESSSSSESDDEESGNASEEDDDFVEEEDNKRKRNGGRRGNMGGAARNRKKPTGKEVDKGDMNWPKCRPASIARKTGNPSNSKNVKSGLRMAVRAKPQQPWKKNLAGYEKDRKLAKGERRMKEYRVIAAAYAKGKFEEVSYDECYKVHEEMKKAYHQGKKLIEAIEKQERVEETGEKESSSEDEWEEMEEFEPVIDDNIEVNLQADEDGVEKDWWVVYLRQEVNKRIRTMWENAHKTHLLSYMYHLNFVVKTSLDESLVPSLMVSHLPSGYLKYVGENIPNDVLVKIVKWYTDAFRPVHGQLSVTSIDEGLIKGQEARYSATSRLSALVNYKVFETDLDRATLLFSLLVGMECIARICVNAQVISRKWDRDQQEQLRQEMETFKERSKSPPQVEPKEKEKGKEESKETKKGKKTTATIKKEIRNYWVEVWSRKEKRWICIDPLNCTVDEPLKIHENATLPISYVFAADNKRGICEISQRYAMDCVKQDFRRRRTDPGWLMWTLSLPIFAANEERKKFERMQMREDLVKRPLPTTMSEYKNHPLYVLEKDLLKFEAIYPPPKQQKPLGQIRGHDVFPRSTVFTLQGENNWLKLARSVKIGEKPYKQVKARPDPRIPVEERVEKFLDVYGYWQTEPYRRPVVKKGKIPRNEYGNVYMFNECMCPIGCTYLKLPGLVQISRKLNKDCVPCVVGWAFDGGWTHPVIDGCVVLDEDAELFREEWEKIEAGRAAKEEQKRQERVLENWKKLIKGMLRLKYVRKEFGVDKEKNKKKKAPKPKVDEKIEEEEEEEDIIDNSDSKKPLDGFSLDDFIKAKK